MSKTQTTSENIILLLPAFDNRLAVEITTFTKQGTSVISMKRTTSPYWVAAEHIGRWLRSKVAEGRITSDEAMGVHRQLLERFPDFDPKGDIKPPAFGQIAAIVAA